jgi:hypothetical protein
LEKIIEERDNEILELMAELNKFEREKVIEINQFVKPMGNRSPV